MMRGVYRFWGYNGLLSDSQGSQDVTGLRRGEYRGEKQPNRVGHDSHDSCSCDLGPA
jgi:hypothetical protein